MKWCQHAVFPGVVLSHVNSMFETSQYIKGDLDLCLALALKAAPSLVSLTHDGSSPPVAVMALQQRQALGETEILLLVFQRDQVGSW